MQMTVMTVHDQSKLIMLAEQGAELDRTDCWKQGKAHWYYKWRMENMKCCWIRRTPIIVLLVLFNLCLAAFTLAAPAHHAAATTTASPPSHDTATTPAVHLPTTDGDSVIHKPPLMFDPTKPTPLSFIKNAKCKLHREDGKTISRRCGLRELDLPDSESGVRYWNPETCRSAHCQCVATKEIRRKEKRSIANNKTTIEYRRFKLFECV